jgi:HD superfamily phosphohydrolase YqeK
LFPADTDPSLFPAPAMLITKEGGMRAHYALKQLSDDLTKSFMQGTAKLGSLLSDTLKNLGAQVAPNSEQRSEKKEVNFALGGRSGRVDYQIQQGIVENEYLSAVTAHSTYFRNSDVLDFIIEAGTETCSSNFVQYHT